MCRMKAAFTANIVVPGLSASLRTNPALTIYADFYPGIHNKIHNKKPSDNTIEKSNNG